MTALSDWGLVAKSECAVGRQLLVVVTLLLSVTGCTIRTEPSSGASGVSRNPAVSAPSAQNDAVAAYKAMWGDLVVAAQTSDAHHARLDDHAEGGALQLLRHMMRDNNEQDLVTKGTPEFAPVVTKTEPSMVTIVDCADDSRWLQYTKDGVLENDVPGGHRRVDATIRRHGGEWTVESLYIDEVGTCVE